jgi:deoxyribonuclease V
MKIRIRHRWDLSPKAAAALQGELRGKVEQSDDLGPVRTVAGTDVSYDRSSNRAQAAIAVLSFPELDLVESSTAVREISFPYVPGLLSFREMPPLIAAFAPLQRPPSLVMCDGHGLAHPRRFGLACHLGVLYDVPTIGVAKSRLVGEHDPLPDRRGAWVPLVDQGETIGAALRTRPGVKPVYVSIGHRTTLETAIQYVLRCAPKYKLPETTRAAHRLSRARGSGSAG